MTMNYRDIGTLFVFEGNLGKITGILLPKVYTGYIYIYVYQYCMSVYHKTNFDKKRERGKCVFKGHSYTLIYYKRCIQV